MRRTVPILCACALFLLTAPSSPARAGNHRPYAGTFLVLNQFTPRPNGDVFIQGLLHDGQATFLGPFRGDVQYLVHPGRLLRGGGTENCNGVIGVRDLFQLLRRRRLPAIGRRP